MPLSGPVARRPTHLSLTAFEELPEHHLSELSDEQLVDYLRAAREAGAHEAMKPAIGILVYGYWDVLVNRARMKLPPADVEDVASEAIYSAIASAFDGKSVGEFRSWLHTILSRRIADHLEGRKRQAHRPRSSPPSTPAPTTYGATSPPRTSRVTPCSPRSASSRPTRRSRTTTTAGSSTCTCWVRSRRPMPPSEIGDGMSEANVHQIASRFQKRFRELFDEGDTAG